MVQRVLDQVDKYPFHQPPVGIGHDRRPSPYHLDCVFPPVRAHELPGELGEVDRFDDRLHRMSVQPADLEEVVDELPQSG